MSSILTLPTTFVAVSFNGRTRDFGPRYLGSTPGAAANFEIWFSKLVAPLNTDMTCQYCGSEEITNAANLSRHQKSCAANIQHPRRKRCVVCPNFFIAPSGVKGSKQICCSRSCANTYFRSGVNNGNWEEPEERKDWDVRYRTKCFEFHEKKCVCCEERKIVAVHHMDEDHSNEAPENLIPLCPTHHAYWHSRYREEIESVVYNYIQRWIHKRSGS